LPARRVLDDRLQALPEPYGEARQIGQGARAAPGPYILAARVVGSVRLQRQPQAGEAARSGLVNECEGIRRDCQSPRGLGEEEQAAAIGAEQMIGMVDVYAHWPCQRRRDATHSSLRLRAPLVVGKRKRIRIVSLLLQQETQPEERPIGAIAEPLYSDATPVRRDELPTQAANEKGIGIAQRRPLQIDFHRTVTRRHRRREDIAISGHRLDFPTGLW